MEIRSLHSTFSFPWSSLCCVRSKACNFVIFVSKILIMGDIMNKKAYILLPLIAKSLIASNTCYGAELYKKILKEGQKSTSK